MPKSTSVKLRDGFDERLKALSETKQRSANWLVNDALEKYLDREEARAAFSSEMKQRHEEYVLGGRLHVTQEEMEEWADRLETDPNAPMPEPHP